LLYAVNIAAGNVSLKTIPFHQVGRPRTARSAGKGVIGRSRTVPLRATYASEADTEI